MLGKVGKSRSGAKATGKSQFGDLVSYIACEAGGKGREVNKGGWVPSANCAAWASALSYVP
ncbi:hypothetical protein FE661_03640 [Acidithiobacillus ferrooxidans]|jgi:hypothetical protein|uniref:Uncharacterized protein n=3 Tax=Acidithiobacillus ferrooxidans TaxID=920 RepID=B7J599_ACIF2|nr:MULTISPECIES: hypothetical protein [Acidithiobacillus]ACH82983.1 hypothetical protein Lferr_0732 [Acidithiobacillus ferrooxidans ATCC 53993]EGQ63969.1 hypothetical protein GGI1_22659 [Acidithiobacillus sp. GGI-221]ACK78111.1 hypothetical protein AFE_0581 [Acidithiobacillus ferrooxidans ATCC 23270]MBN6744862.1 hypothetical protein [Acidithiobacillus sp. MC2.2]MBN6747393.1 hypothetical protein [Acidithiobacillus sp. PG05]